MGDYVQRNKNTHLTLDLRIDIENCLDRNLKLKEIANYIHTDERTVSKEIKRNRIIVETKETNKCAYKKTCHKHLLCGTLGCSNDCRNCKVHNCNMICKSYSSNPTCKRVTRFPYVCNACPTRHTCRFNRWIYKAKDAQERYEGIMSASHRHLKFINQIEQIDEVVSKYVRNGISPEVILLDHADELPKMSLATLYSLIDGCHLSVRNIDLKRKPGRRRKISFHKEKINADPKVKEGRYYEDFLEYIGNNPTLDIWELDTVEGKKGGKALMTLLERKSNFMLIFLISSVSQEEIIRVFDMIKSKLDSDLFLETFPIILTDNGKEFLDPISIEYNKEDGVKVCNLFFCKARHSEQKGKLEKNHEHIREVLPKGTDFDFLVDEAVDILSNNVNNYTRPKFKCSPYLKVKPYIDKKVLRLNNISHLRDVILKPRLLNDFRFKKK